MCLLSFTGLMRFVDVDCASDHSMLVITLSPLTIVQLSTECVQLQRNPLNGQPTGDALITFHTRTEAERAVQVSTCACTPCANRACRAGTQSPRPPSTHNSVVCVRLKSCACVRVHLPTHTHQCGLQSTHIRESIRVSHRVVLVNTMCCYLHFCLCFLVFCIYLSRTNTSSPTFTTHIICSKLHFYVHIISLFLCPPSLL